MLKNFPRKRGNFKARFIARRHRNWNVSRADLNLKLVGVSGEKPISCGVRHVRIGASFVPWADGYIPVLN